MYVDDLLLAASTEEELEELVSLLQKVWKIKVTGSLPWGQPGVLQFLGRQILREREGDGPFALRGRARLHEFAVECMETRPVRS